MKDIKRITYLKEGNAWKECFTETDPAEVEHRLLADIVAKKMHKCTYITSIKERTNYDGTRTFTVYYSNATKSVYTVEMQ